VIIPGSFAVALKDPAASPLGPAAFLSGLGGHDQDSALRLLRAQPGFFGRRLPLEAARKLAAAAAAAGFETVLVSELDVKPLPAALSAVKVEPKAGGFAVQASGAVKFMPFEAVSFFTAAAYEAPVQPPSLAALKTGLFQKLSRLAGVPGPVPAAASGYRETFFRADIIAEDGALRFLLEPENLDFSPLGAARSHSSLANFRALLGRISGPCFNAVKNPFLAAFLESRPLAALKFAGPDACDTDLSRLLLVARRPG